MLTIGLVAWGLAAGVLIRAVLRGLRRPEPTLYQRCLAVHLAGAEVRSALR